VFDVLLNLGYAFTIYKEILHTYTIDNFYVNVVLLTILL
jgi:glutamate synthase domain-containing protein 1